MIESVSLLLSIMAGVSVVCITGFSLYFKIRPKFPIHVNCWFCNTDTDVPYGNRNCWDCPNCEQYNGFFPDGGYNKVIPAQHDELLNHAVIDSKKQTLKSPMSGPGLTGKLCRKCNLNQELKIQQLSSFTPLDPARFDEEVEQYRQHLERSYRLCGLCEGAVQDTLRRQQAWLLEQNQNGLLQDKHVVSGSWLPATFYLPPLWLNLFSCLTALVAALLLLATAVQMSDGHFSLSLLATLALPTDLYISPTTVAMLQNLLTYETMFTAAVALLFLTTLVTNRRTMIDCLGVVFWLLLHCQCVLVQWEHLERYINLLDFKIVHMVTLFITLCFGMIAVFVSRLNLKKSLNSKHYTNISKRHKRGRDITGYFSSSEKKCEDHSASLDPQPTFTKLYSKPDSLTLTDAASIPDTNLDCELDKGICNLTLGTSPPRPKETVSVFKTKIYGQNNGSDLFSCDGDSLRHGSRRILSPPKFGLRKNVTQSSWVAGGYWQVPRTFSRPTSTPPVSGELTGFAPLSRSSSQSSGFGSQCSLLATSLPNSRTGSMCGAGDADCFSVLSEPTYQPFFTPAHPAFFGMTCYGGPPVFMHHACTPHGFLSPFRAAMPQYFSHRAEITGTPWMTSTFPPQAIKPAEILSQSGSSQQSTQSRNSAPRINKVNSHHNFLSVVKDNMLLAIIFFSSILVNMLGLGYIALRSQNMILPGVP